MVKRRAFLAKNTRIRGYYENRWDEDTKMKENLINDEEQAFCQTLATIDTKAPIEIGLNDLSIIGPNVEARNSSEMGFKQLKQAS